MNFCTTKTLSLRMRKPLGAVDLSPTLHPIGVSKILKCSPRGELSFFANLCSQGVGTTFSAHIESEKCSQVPGSHTPTTPYQKRCFWDFGTKIQILGSFEPKNSIEGKNSRQKNPARKEKVVRVYIYICTSRSLQENLPAPTVAQPPIGVSKKIQMLTLAIWQGPPFVLGAPFFLKKILDSCPSFFFFFFV